MEIQRVAAASTYVAFPMLTTAGVVTSGLTVTGKWAAWSDTVGLTSQGNPGFRPLSGAFVESGATGIYGGFLASTELPAASPYVALQFSASGAATQYLLVRTATYFANASTVGAGAITSGSFAAGAIDSSAIAAEAIGASELGGDAVMEIATAFLDANIVGGHGNDNSVGLSLRRMYFATQYLNAAILTAGSGYADDFLGRTLDRSGSGGRTVSQALMALRNKVSISAGTLTVTSVDDTTSEWTATIATQAVTAIVTSIDPA